MYCTGCGSKIDDDVRFCPDCGKAVSESTPSASSSVTRQPTMTAAYVRAFRNYAIFRGRAGRSEYWRFALPQLAVTAILALPFTLPLIGIGAVFYIGDCIHRDCESGWYSLLFTLLALNLLVFGIPLLSATARRLHDTDKSGAWLLLVLVPIALVVGTTIFAGSLFTDNQDGTELGVILFELFLGTFAKLYFWGGVVWMVVILLPKGDKGENRYGAPPACGMM